MEQLKLGAGQVFHGEGILAVTKALLQSGVSYVGGYQGAPVSHLLDVMVQARDYLDTLGVHVEPCTSEASAAAMLGASINYPARGAVTWKSIVGTNVAADALSNLSSPGVIGGALIVTGADVGDGASVIQERTHAFAMKSSLWLLDPRPDLPTIVRMVEHGFELSEASNTPVILELRIRACHLRGAFATRDNRAPQVSTRQRLAQPAGFDYDRLAHPPATFAQERLKVERRLPAARRFVREAQLNERVDGAHQDIGIVVQGGLSNSLMRALQHLGLADAYGNSRVPLLILNVVYPLVPEELAEFARGKRALLMVEEGHPEFIELELVTHLKRAGLEPEVHGKDMLSASGEYSVELLLRGVGAFVARYLGSEAAAPGAGRLQALDRVRRAAAAALGGALPPRPPTFCVGCPERPVFAALKLARQDVGPMHYAADIGCHAFATFAPFSFGNSILGYGMSLASSAGVAPLSGQRPLAVMGDGGFWHNGLLSGVASNMMNGGDAVLVVMKNGYSSATGTQELISSPDERIRHGAGGASATHTERTIEGTLRGMGVRWLRTVHTYRVGEMRRTLQEAFTTDAPGLKVVVAEGECQLERQRRLRPLVAGALAAGRRVVRVRYGVDEDVCTGDHSCIRLSGCPSLAIADPSDPLRVDPVARVDQNCVGCGLCGDNAHAATLCPSFYRVEIVQNPNWWDRLLSRARNRITAWMRKGSRPAAASEVAHRG
ncbi:MAG: indolepyruvate ferredoxin oxidoreductase subunit alpha [Burkholderiales bacterium]|nr:MAG: indolepyruvate ferredoxin oxidoreductase subunit alpha [Burkholderiales bacterium]